MSENVTVWNVTLATKESPTNLHMYGKVIRPGACTEIDGSWVRQYPKPLASAKANKTVHVGETLPEWYDKALEEQMKKITHKGQSPSILKGEGFHPTQMKPGDSVELDDEVVKTLELEEQPWMYVEDAEAQAEAPEEDEAPKEEEPEEEPEEKAPAPKKKKAPAKKAEAKEEAPAKKKKRNIRRGKKKD